MDLGNTYGMARYEGTVYHPSVKNIPSLLRENITHYGVQSSSKYVEKTVSYPYNYMRYELGDYPMTIFYNDGVYKGYITHTDSLPVDKARDRIYITYGGTVYSGNNYPVPFVNEKES